MSQLKHELDVAVELARTAGAAILEQYQGPIDIEQKNFDDDSEPVTQADRIANELIVTRLQREFPGDGILAEESVDTSRRLDKSRVWLVDPLDGTNGFIAGNGDFAVQIGLAQDGEPVVAVVYLPSTGVLYRAVRGDGTWIERPQFEPEKARVSDVRQFAEMRLAASRSHHIPQNQEIVGCEPYLGHRDDHGLRATGDRRVRAVAAQLVLQGPGHRRQGLTMRFPVPGRRHG